MLVDPGQGLHRDFSPLAPLPADENALGVEEVGDGAALRQKLGVGKDLVFDPGLLVDAEDGADALGGLDGDGGLLHDDLEALLDRVRDVASRELHVLQIGSLALA